MLGFSHPVSAEHRSSSLPLLICHYPDTDILLTVNSTMEEDCVCPVHLEGQQGVSLVSLQPPFSNASMFDQTQIQEFRGEYGEKGD